MSSNNHANGFTGTRQQPELPSMQTAGLACSFALFQEPKPDKTHKTMSLFQHPHNPAPHNIKNMSAAPSVEDNDDEIPGSQLTPSPRRQGRMEESSNYLASSQMSQVEGDDFVSSQDNMLSFSQVARRGQQRRSPSPTLESLLQSYTREDLFDGANIAKKESELANMVGHHNKENYFGSASQDPASAKDDGSEITFTQILEDINKKRAAAQLLSPSQSDLVQQGNRNPFQLMSSGSSVSSNFFTQNSTSRLPQLSGTNLFTPASSNGGPFASANAGSIFNNNSYEESSTVFSDRAIAATPGVHRPTPLPVNAFQRASANSQIGGGGLMSASSSFAQSPCFPLTNGLFQSAAANMSSQSGPGGINSQGGPGGFVNPLQRAGQSGNPFQMVSSQCFQSELEPMLQTAGGLANPTISDIESYSHACSSGSIIPPSQPELGSSSNQTAAAVLKKDVIGKPAPKLAPSFKPVFKKPITKPTILKGISNLENKNGVSAMKDRQILKDNNKSTKIISELTDHASQQPIANMESDITSTSNDASTKESTSQVFKTTYQPKAKLLKAKNSNVASKKPEFHPSNTAKKPSVTVDHSEPREKLTANEIATAAPSATKNQGRKLKKTNTVPKPIIMVKSEAELLASSVNIMGAKKKTNTNENTLQGAKDVTRSDGTAQGVKGNDKSSVSGKRKLPSALPRDCANDANAKQTKTKAQQQKKKAKTDVEEKNKSQTPHATEKGSSKAVVTPQTAGNISNAGYSAVKDERDVLEDTTCVDGEQHRPETAPQASNGGGDFRTSVLERQVSEHVGTKINKDQRNGASINNNECPGDKEDDKQDNSECKNGTNSRDMNRKDDTANAGMTKSRINDNDAGSGSEAVSLSVLGEAGSGAAPVTCATPPQSVSKCDVTLTPHPGMGMISSDGTGPVPPLRGRDFTPRVVSSPMLHAGGTLTQLTAAAVTGSPPSLPGSPIVSSLPIHSPNDDFSHHTRRGCSSPLALSPLNLSIASSKLSRSPSSKSSIASSRPESPVDDLAVISDMSDEGDSDTNVRESSVVREDCHQDPDNICKSVNRKVPVKDNCDTSKDVKKKTPNAKAELGTPGEKALMKGVASTASTAKGPGAGNSGQDKAKVGGAEGMQRSLKDKMEDIYAKVLQRAVNNVENSLLGKDGAVSRNKQPLKPLVRKPRAGPSTIRPKKAADFKKHPLVTNGLESIVSKPPSDDDDYVTQLKRHLLELQQLTPRAVWAQCDECGKWRRIPGHAPDPADLPNRWTCALNNDAACNSCNVPEETWENNNPDHYIMNTYTLGSVVWVSDRSSHHPAMVDDDPDTDTFLWLPIHSTEPNYYHVTFFGSPATRSWERTSALKPFTSAEGDVEMLKITREVRHNSRLAEAVRQATLAKSLPIEDRRRKYCFAARYRGPWFAEEEKMERKRKRPAKAKGVKANKKFVHFKQ